MAQKATTLVRHFLTYTNFVKINFMANIRRLKEGWKTERI